jgi:uncharacterized protein YegP (UPF0339 family)
MPKTKNRPGIHLLITTVTYIVSGKKKEYYWHIVARNGRIIARSSETYSRKSGAVKSIKVAANIFRYKHVCSFYDHSKPDSPLQSYL